MNKKAVVFNVLMWFFKIFFLIIVLFSLVLLIRSFIITELDIFNAESDIFIQRILMSRTGISYYDKDVDRLYPGIIDIGRFTLPTIERILNESIYFGTENKKIAASLTLKNEIGTTIKTIIFNSDFYFTWEKMYKAQWLKGPGGINVKARKFEVLIKGTELKRGSLDIVVIIPNS